MVRLRLPEHPAVDYQFARDNFGWPDHILRLQSEAALIAWFKPDSVLDPACGDASVVAASHRVRLIESALLGDISKPNFYNVGTIMRPFLPPKTEVLNQSIEITLGVDRQFDVVVLTEILEHVDDPVMLLKLARARARFLVASSPVFEGSKLLDTNPEHLWQFDAPGYSEMLKEAGWDPIVFMPLQFHIPGLPYNFQIWGAR